MDADLNTLVDLLTGLWAQVEALAATMLRPRQFSQLLLALVLLGLSHLLAALIEPRLIAWTRSREGWPKWRLRWMVVIRQRLRLILFVILIWIAVIVVRQIIVWPSARYILTLIASIATAWLIVALATRLIRNRFLQRLVSWGAWIWVTLYYVGLLDETYELLDSLALEFGDFRLSILLLLQAVVATGVLFTLARLITQSTSSRIRQNEDLSPSMQVLAVKVLQMLLYGAAFFIGLKAVGFDLTGLAVLSGAIGVGLGFGLQKVVSNLVSGIIILLDKSIKPGDVISLGETFGWINSLGARYVSITTRDGKEYLIPNEDLITGQVVNWSHSNDFVRLDIYFGTAYDNDPHRVRAIAIEAASRVPRVLNDRSPVCHIVGFGDSSVDYILRFWISDPTGGLTNIRGAVFLALWDAFAAEGISIPFPQREVRLLAEEGADQSAGTASSMSPG